MRKKSIYGKKRAVSFLTFSNLQAEKLQQVDKVEKKKEGDIQEQGKKETLHGITKKKKTVPDKHTQKKNEKPNKKKKAHMYKKKKKHSTQNKKQGKRTEKSESNIRQRYSELQL